MDRLMAYGVEPEDDVMVVESEDGMMIGSRLEDGTNLT